MPDTSNRRPESVRAVAPIRVTSCDAAGTRTIARRAVADTTADRFTVTVRAATARRANQGAQMCPRPVTVPPGVGGAEHWLSGVQISSRHERLEAQPRSVPQARDTMTEFAGGHGASAAQCKAVALAVSEAVANAIVHGYAGGDGAAIVELRASVHEHSLVIVVCDYGVGIGHAGPSQGLGLGLPLIARLTDQLQVASRSPNPGTRVHMTFLID